MSSLDPSMRRLLAWAIPIALLGIALGIELDWGGSARRSVLPPEMAKPPAPVGVRLLPEYAIAGGAAALQATSEHTLFNPTRRPAPPAVAVAANGGPSQMKRGQFILTGTAVYGDKAVAYLKAAAGGKPHTVQKGETINGMLVARIDSQGVRFTKGGESEDLPLKIAAGPKTTVQPATAAPRAPGTGGGGVPVNARGQPRPGAQPGNPANPSQPESLGERRRAARAAEAERQRAGQAKGASDPEAQGAASGTAATSPAPPAPAANGHDPRCQQRYQRDRGRGAHPN